MPDPSCTVTLTLCNPILILHDGDISTTLNIVYIIELL